MADWRENIFLPTRNATHRRLDDLKDVVITRGNFTEEEWQRSILLPVETDGEVQEKIAHWLRDELATLNENRQGSKRGNLTKSAVRGLGAMSPITISDLAMTMVEVRVDQPGPELLSLLLELFGLDVHRRSLAEAKVSEQQMAAQIQARDPKVSARSLATKTGVAHPTILRWQKDPDYIEAVEFEQFLLAHPNFWDEVEKGFLNQIEENPILKAAAKRNADARDDLKNK